MTCETATSADDPQCSTQRSSGSGGSLTPLARSSNPPPTAMGGATRLPRPGLFRQVEKISIKIPTPHQARCVHMLFDHISPHFSCHLHVLFRSNPVSSFMGGYSYFSGVCSVQVCTVIPATL